MRSPLYLSLALCVCPAPFILGQDWTLPAVRLSSGNATISTHQPIVVSPYTAVSMPTEDRGRAYANNPTTTNSNDMTAYQASGSTVQTDVGIASAQTTAQATCNTPTDSSDFAPAVDTLLTGIISIEGEVEANAGAVWQNATLVETQFQVQNRDGYDPVHFGDLAGFLWLKADVNGGGPGFTGLSTPLSQYAELLARVGDSNLTAHFLGSGNGWYLEGTVYHSSWSDPSNAGDTYSDYTSLDSIDEFHDCQQLVVVPMNLALYSEIWYPAYIFNSNSQISGTSIEEYDFDVSLKASANFSVTASHY